MSLVNPLDLLSEIKRYGWSDNQALGMLGGLLGEARLEKKDGLLHLDAKSVERNPRHNKGIGQGLAQWTSPDRIAAFKKIIGVAPIDAGWQDQVKFINWELRNTHTAAASKIKNSTTVAEALNAFVKKYEIPANANEAVQKRYKILQGVLQASNAWSGLKQASDLAQFAVMPDVVAQVSAKTNQAIRDDVTGWLTNTVGRGILGVAGAVFLIIGLTKLKDF